MSYRITRSPISYLQTMQRRQRAGAMLLAMCLLALALAALTTRPRTAHAQSPPPTPTPAPTPSGPPPDYSKIGNALAGVTHILRQDDVVVNMGAYVKDSDADFYPSTVSAITTANSNGKQNFDGFDTPDCNPCYYRTSYFTQDTTNVTGRFFRTRQDTLISYPSVRNNQVLVDIMTGTVNGNGNASFAWNSAQPLPYTTDNTTISQGYAADFNQDGYDDLLMVYSDYTLGSNYSWNARMRIATANDVNDPSKGLNIGSEQQLGFGEGIRSTAIGDFNGDGQPDIAVLRVEGNNDLILAIFKVDPTTLAVSWTGQQTVVENLKTSVQNQPIQLVAGNFTGATNQQLVVANPSGTNQTIKVRIFDFSQGPYTPIVRKTWDSGASATNIKLLTSKFDWDSPYDVISFMQTIIYSDKVPSSYVYLLTVDPGNYAITKSATLDVQETYGSQIDPSFKLLCVALDITAGNFNNQKPDPADSSLKLSDPNLQLAVAVAYVAGTQTNKKENFALGSVNIVQVIDPQKDEISLAPISTIQVTPQPGNDPVNFQQLTINAADLQGRSLRLGGGVKIPIEMTSPSLILAAPPMHVDYATPANSSTPNVLNLSLAPTAFFTKYEQDTATGSSHRRTDTTSSSFNGAETISGSMAFGSVNETGELTSGVKISTSFEAKQDINHSKDVENGEYQSTELDITQQTDLGDVLWFADTTYYLYIYEVVGQTVCPNGKATCDDSARVPMTLLFSGPAVSTTQHVSAETQEWYQPLWQYGNILSYPGNYAQLKNNNVKLDEPLNNSDAFATDDSPTTEVATIIDGGDSTTTWTASQLFTEDSDISVTTAGKATIPFTKTGFFGTAGLDLNFGGSTGAASLTVGTTTSQETDKITVNKTASFPAPGLYQYGMTTTIYGEKRPAGFDDNYGAKYPKNVTYGPLRTGCTVTPGTNNWWGQAYRTADVGLNHPQRWAVTNTNTPSASSGRMLCKRFSEFTTVVITNPLHHFLF